MLRIVIGLDYSAKKSFVYSSLPPSPLLHSPTLNPSLPLSLSIRFPFSLPFFPLSPSLSLLPLSLSTLPQSLSLSPPLPLPQSPSIPRPLPFPLSPSPENSASDYVLFQAGSTIREAIIREWELLSRQERDALRGYILHYITTKPKCVCVCACVCVCVCCVCGYTCILQTPSLPLSTSPPSPLSPPHSLLPPHPPSVWCLCEGAAATHCGSDGKESDTGRQSS